MLNSTLSKTDNISLGNLVFRLEGHILPTESLNNNNNLTSFLAFAWQNLSKLLCQATDGFQCLCRPSNVRNFRLATQNFCQAIFLPTEICSYGDKLSLFFVFAWQRIRLVYISFFLDTSIGIDNINYLNRSFA